MTCTETTRASEIYR